jgi:hypothetical protein
MSKNKQGELGLIEFLKRDNVSETTTSTDKQNCPSCGSPATTQVANMRVCNQCSHQWDLVRDVISERARRAKADAVGYPARNNTR